MAQQQRRIGFVGAGRMATALARGFVAAGCASPEHIVAFDPLSDAAEAFARATGSATVASNADVAAAADIVFLSVKPQQMAAVLGELKGRLTGDHLVVSIAAGIRLDTLAQALGAGPRLVRVMPNTPCLVGESASAFAVGPDASAEDAATVRELLDAVGTAYPLDEKLLDAVTGLSGSGPGFVFLLIEALVDGGVRMGLPRDVASALAAQTFKGAAAMVLETDDTPEVLRGHVTSPGGTTIAGLQVLEERAVRGAVIAAVEAATLRSQELSQSD